MNYLGIIKRAYQITLNHRYLWILGILAGGIGGGVRGLNISLPSNTSFKTDKFDQIILDKYPTLIDFWNQYWGPILVIVFALILLGIIFTIISVVSQGALLGAVESAEKKETNNFWQGIGFGFRKFWQVFGIGLFLALLVILSLIILVVPLIIFIISKIWVLAVVYGLLLFFINLVFYLFLGIIFPYSLRMAVLGNLGVRGAIKNSWSFFNKNWQEIVIIWLILCAIGIGIGIGLILLFLLVGGLLAGIGLAIFLISKIALYIYAGVFGLALVALMIIISGIINAFNSSVYTLTYLELSKKS